MKEKQPIPQSVLLPYTGGHTVIYGGYVFELCPDHPKGNRFGFVAQHRLIVERALGYYLQSHQLVHHIDHNKANNDLDNLQVMSKGDHLRLHRRQARELKYSPLTHEIVEQALAEGGLKAAARALGCHTQTIRLRFPKLVEPYKRKSPTKIDDPKVIATILKYAQDGLKSVRDTVAETGVSHRTIMRICDRNGVEWKAPYRGVGEIHKQYRKRTSRTPLEARDRSSESA